ncbi:hypothetical protein GCM10018785_23640 [Streptomyces longispororuber]|uniref:Uncharacterized protein n=1 Tax=Streptomyces longispororuber TaxID=68230 RepID=A0A918ZHD5_9ACTN|nr:hypothetical protein GCM10018785_23640 [Streptomyces longispororuber]
MVGARAVRDLVRRRATRDVVWGRGGQDVVWAGAVRDVVWGAAAPVTAGSGSGGRLPLSSAGRRPRAPSERCRSAPA